MIASRPKRRGAARRWPLALALAVAMPGAAAAPTRFTPPDPADRIALRGGQWTPLTRSCALAAGRRGPAPAHRRRGGRGMGPVRLSGRGGARDRPVGGLPPVQRLDRAEAPEQGLAGPDPARHAAGLDGGRPRRLPRHRRLLDQRARRGRHRHPEPAARGLFRRPAGRCPGRRPSSPTSCAARAWARWTASRAPDSHYVYVDQAIARTDGRAPGPSIGRGMSRPACPRSATCSAPTGAGPSRCGPSPTGAVIRASGRCTATSWSSSTARPASSA